MGHPREISSTEFLLRARYGIYGKVEIMDGHYMVGATIVSGEISEVKYSGMRVDIIFSNKRINDKGLIKNDWEERLAKGTPIYLSPEKKAVKLTRPSDGNLLLSISLFSSTVRFCHWFIMWHHLGVRCGNTFIEMSEE